MRRCRDAVAGTEYLYHAKRYSEISFNFVSGFKCDYIHYADGFRYHNDHWVLKAKKDYGYNIFMNYMELVFAYASTLSLEKELKPVADPGELKAGDVFIHGGSHRTLFYCDGCGRERATSEAIPLSTEFYARTKYPGASKCARLSLV